MNNNNNNKEYTFDLDIGKKDTNMDELLAYAAAFNFLTSMEALSYGTKGDFIKDNMQKCITNGIITKECNEDPVWTEHGIQIEDVPDNLKSCTEVRSFKLYYNDDPNKPPPSYWKFEFKHVVLPENWRLEMGCGCDRNIRPGCFSIYNDKDEIIKTLTYFIELDEDDSKSGMERIMDLDEKMWSDFDALEYKN